MAAVMLKHTAATCPCLAPADFIVQAASACQSSVPADTFAVPTRSNPSNAHPANTARLDRNFPRHALKVPSVLPGLPTRPCARRNTFAQPRPRNHRAAPLALTALLVWTNLKHALQDSIAPEESTRLSFARLALAVFPRLNFPSLAHLANTAQRDRQNLPKNAQ